MSGLATRQVLPIATRAMDAFLAAPVQLFGVDAGTILRDASAAVYDVNRDRRRRIEGMLERLEDLRQSLIAKLDAIDGDPDLEPYLSSLGWRAPLESDECEPDADFEPSLSAGGLIDQRCWIIGGDTDAEDEHCGREPEDEHGHDGREQEDYA